MKRDEIKGIVPEITDEQLSKILDINTADIGKAKTDYTDLKAKYDAEVKTRQELETEIQKLKDSAADTEGLNKKIADLQKEIDDRKTADEQAVKDKAMADRFGAAIGDKKFLNDFTQKGVLDEFKAALADKANTGKSDADVFAAIIKDREGLFENPNPLSGTPGANGNVTLPGAATNDQLSKMSYEEYKAFRNGKKE
jgi:hypothetical protein